MSYKYKGYKVLARDEAKKRISEIIKEKDSLFEFIENLKIEVSKKQDDLDDEKEEIESFIEGFNIEWWEEIKDTGGIPERYVNDTLTKPIKTLKEIGLEKVSEEITQCQKDLLSEMENLPEDTTTNYPPLPIPKPELTASGIQKDFLERMEKLDKLCGEIEYL